MPKLSRKKILIILLVLPLVVFLIQKKPIRQAKAAGNTYYVTPNGNDSNSGTESRPWRTIQKAANTLQSGDIVIVQAGQYNESINITRSGTNGNPIIFQGSDDPHLKGKFVVEADYIHIKDFEIEGFETGGSSQKIPGVSVEGDYIEIINNNIHDTYGPGVHIKATPMYTGTTSNHNTIRGNTISYAVEAGIRIEGQYHLVENNNISHTKDYPPNHTYITDADGIRFFGKGHLIKGNTIHDILHSECSGEPHIDCFQSWENAYEIVFERNFCHLADSNGMIKLAMLQRGTNSSNYEYPVRDLVFKNNLFISNSPNKWTPLNIGNEACSINYPSYPVKNITIVNNTFDYLKGGGDMALLLRCIDGITIKNNLFIGWGNSSYPYINLAQDPNQRVTNYDISHNAVYKSDGVPPKDGPFPGDNIKEIWMQDPQLASPANRDYHLTASSPLIDAGLTISEVTHDYEGNPRPQGTGYDIGAYEYTGGVQPTATPIPPSSPTPTPSSPYDLSGDGQVNAADTLILLGNWRNSSQGDFNSDGKVNSLDFGLLIAHWGR